MNGELDVRLDRKGKFTLSKDGRDITPAVERLEVVLRNGVVLEAKVDIRYPDKVVTETWG